MYLFISIFSRGVVFFLPARGRVWKGVRGRGKTIPKSGNQKTINAEKSLNGSALVGVPFSPLTKLDLFYCWNFTLARNPRLTRTCIHLSLHPNNFFSLNFSLLFFQSDMIFRLLFWINARAVIYLHQMKTTQSCLFFPPSFLNHKRKFMVSLKNIQTPKSNYCCLKSIQILIILRKVH